MMAPKTQKTASGQNGHRLLGWGCALLALGALILIVSTDSVFTGSVAPFVLILAACGLMHVFMHGHGHRIQNESSSRAAKTDPETAPRSEPHRQLKVHGWGDLS